MVDWFGMVPAHLIAIRKVILSDHYVLMNECRQCNNNNDILFLCSAFIHYDITSLSGRYALLKELWK